MTLLCLSVYLYVCENNFFMTKIFSFVNHKGGVGKTTTTLNLGKALNQFHHKRVLLIDLDAQANLSSSLGLNTEDGNTIYEALSGKIKLPIKNIDTDFDIIVSSLDMSAIELELSNTISRETILQRLLAPIKQNYDYILIDCPPSIGLLTINALTASSDIIIILQSEYLALKGMVKLLQAIDKVKELINPKLNFAGVLLTQFDERLNLSREVEQTMINHFKDKLFKTKIRKNIALAEAPSMNQTIFEFNPSSNGAKDYKAFSDEIINRIEL